MKFRYYLMAIPMAFLLVSCASSGGDPDANFQSTAAPAPLTSTPPPVGGGGNNGGGSSGNSGCIRETTNYTSVHTTTVSNTSSASKTATFSALGNSSLVPTDNSLRIRMRPNSVTVQPYTELGVDVELRNRFGTLLTSVSLPTQTGHGDNSQHPNSTRNGTKVGQYSDIVDLSGDLDGQGPYYFVVKNIMSNRKCDLNCNAQTYYLCNSWGCWPDYNAIAQCEYQMCDIGPIYDNGYWNIQLQVETNETPCF